MKKRERKYLNELPKNPCGGILGQLKNPSSKAIYVNGGITKADVADLLNQLSQLKRI